MRLWSLHPEYLDRQGLTACWREGLLAQKVLAGQTRGYRNHPQLQRFAALPDPMAGIGAYLLGIQQQATERGYHFDAARITRPSTPVPTITVTDGQLAFERSHLLAKLAVRTPDAVAQLEVATAPRTHPLFTVEPGPIAEWERP